MTRVVIVGGGPGGYEAALVGRRLGGEVTLIDPDGLGGSAVLTDCVPSKTLIATAEVMTEVRGSADLGLRFGPQDQAKIYAGVHLDLPLTHEVLSHLAGARRPSVSGALTRLAEDGRLRREGRTWILSGDPPDNGDSAAA